MSLKFGNEKDVSLVSKLRLVRCFGDESFDTNALDGEFRKRMVEIKRRFIVLGLWMLNLMARELLSLIVR